MTLNWKRLLFPVAIAWALVNLAGLVWAVTEDESMHALVHLVFVVVFAWLAGWLWRNPKKPERTPRVDVLEDELSDLQRQLSEAQQSRDFAEQLLAQRQAREADPLRYAPRQPDNSARRSLDQDPDTPTS